MQERYGCRLCDKQYAKVYEPFHHGLCHICFRASTSWDQLIIWAHYLLAEDTMILDLRTDRPRAVAEQGKSPAISLKKQVRFPWKKPEAYLLTGYEALPLVSGEMVYSISEITATEDLSYLRFLITSSSSPLIDRPLVLMASPFALNIAQFAIKEEDLNPNLETIPQGGNHYARFGYRWTRILQSGGGLVEEEYLAQAATASGLALQSGETNGQLLRRFVLHRANQTLLDNGSTNHP